MLVLSWPADVRREEVLPHGTRNPLPGYPPGAAPRALSDMLTREDCIAFSGLTEEEVGAIARHERIPEMAACALGEHLLDQPDGPTRIRDMIIDNVRAAQRAADQSSVQSSLHALHHFLRSHPDAIPKVYRWSRLHRPDP